MRSGDEVIRVFARVGGYGAMRQLFDELFTPAERRDFALRWRLMGMLRQGIPQRIVAARLGISLCKITRGSKVLKARDSVCRRMLETSPKANRKPGAGGRAKAGKRERRGDADHE